MISPLIALQRDQLASLEAGGKLKAVALNSVGRRENDGTLLISFLAMDVLPTSSSLLRSS